MRAKTCQEIAEQFHTFVKQQLPTKLLMEAIYIYAVFISVIIVIFVIIEATACMFTCLFVCLYMCDCEHPLLCKRGSKDEHRAKRHQHLAFLRLNLLLLCFDDCRGMDTRVVILSTDIVY